MQNLMNLVLPSESNHKLTKNGKRQIVLKKRIYIYICLSWSNGKCSFTCKIFYWHRISLQLAYSENVEERQFLVFFIKLVHEIKNMTPVPFRYFFKISKLKGGCFFIATTYELLLLRATQRQLHTNYIINIFYNWWPF